MAKMNIAGNALVVTSGMTLEQLNMVKKYRPGALKLMGGEKKDQEIFCIDTYTGNGGISAYGACFGSVTHDDEKKACITIVLEGVKGDIKEYVADTYGEAYTHLCELEATLPGVIEEITTQKSAIMAAITVA